MPDTETQNLAQDYLDEDPLTSLTEEQLQEIAAFYGLTLQRVKVLAKEMSKARHSIDFTEIAPEQEEKEESISAAAGGNPCHGPDGRFCETHGVTHSTAGVDMKHPLALVSNKPVPKTIRSQVTEVLGAIASIHGVPADALPVPFKSSTAKGAHGSYSYKLNAERTPTSIAIKTEKAHTGSVPPHLELTIAHEFGHYLDGQVGFGGTKGVDATTNSSTMSPALKNLFTVIGQTPSYQELVRVQHSNEKYRKNAALYASRSETFARAYAQWVTTKTGNAKMKKQLDYIRKEHFFELARSSQWSDAEFGSISEAMDAIFKERGILR